MAVKPLVNHLSPEENNTTYDTAFVQSHYFLEPCRRPRADYTLKVIKSLGKNLYVIESGCSSGLLVDTLTRAGYRSTGLDSSAEAIRFAEEHCEGEFILGAIEDIKKKYDVVTICHLLEHMTDPIDYLKQIKHIMNPHGFLYIAVPNLYDAHHAPLTALTDPTHVIGLSKRSLTLILQKAGYEVVKIETKSALGLQDKKNRLGRLAYSALKKIKGVTTADEELKKPARKLGLRVAHRIISKSKVTKTISSVVSNFYDWRGRGEEVISIATPKKEEIK